MTLHSANNKPTPIGIDVFWNKPTVDSPFPGILRTQLKLAMLDRNIIIKGTLLGPKPEQLQILQKIFHEETIQGSTAESER